MKVFLNSLKRGVRALIKPSMVRTQEAPSNLLAKGITIKGALPVDLAEFATKKGLTISQISELTGLQADEISKISIDATSLEKKYPDADYTLLQKLALIKALKQKISKSSSKADKTKYQDALIKTGLDHIDFNLIVHGKSVLTPGTIEAEIASMLKNAIKNKEEGRFPEVYTKALKDFINAEKSNKKQRPSFKNLALSQDLAPTQLTGLKNILV